MRRTRTAWAILLPWLLAAPAAAAEAGLEVCVQPLGRHDAALAEVAARAIRERFGLPARVLGGVPLPSKAFYPPRGRYRAERLLSFLDAAFAGRPGCRFVVGFTALDISTSKGDVADWGIFGLGEIGGRSCVVSSFRLARGGPAASLLRDRVAKVATHELGHVLGLDHCPRPGCLMQDARGTVRTVDGEPGALCAACAARLRRLHGPGLTLNPD